jgi:hypothetical protein
LTEFFDVRRGSFRAAYGSSIRPIASSATLPICLAPFSEFETKSLGIPASLGASPMGIALNNDDNKTSANAGRLNAAFSESGEFNVTLLVIVDPIGSRAAEIELEMDSVTIGSIRRRTLLMHTGGQSCLRKRWMLKATQPAESEPDKECAKVFLEFDER